MTSFAKVLILFVIVSLPEIRTELSEPQVSRNNEKTVTNSSNTSTTCHFHILESSLKSVLKLMQNSKTNAIKLNLWIESINDTMTLMNKNRLPTDMLWVNELGRTLYSLKLETSWYTRTLISYLRDVTLTAGFRDVNIVVSENNKRCLLSRNNTMDHVIFDILLFQLYRVSDVKTDYQFCHTYNLALNCCRIFPGDKNIRICSHYSSLFLPYYNFYLIVSLFVLYISFCLTVDFFSRLKANNRDSSTSYNHVSTSPMALSYIFYVIFIKRLKSFGRKLLIVAFVAAIYAPVRNIDLNFIMSSPLRIVQYAGLSCWAIIFLVFDLYGCSKPQKSNKSLEDIGYYMLKITAYPFNLGLFWKNVTETWNIFGKYLCLSLPLKYKLLKYTHGNDEKYSADEYSDDEVYCYWQHCRLKTIWEYSKYSISIFIVILFYLVFFLPFSLLFTVFKWCIHIWLLFRDRGMSVLKGLIFFFIFVSDIVLLTICFVYFFRSTVLFAIGLFLNGKIFINFFLPLSTILFYSWTNWKSSVETKYLVLITSIYEVCKDSTLKPNALGNSEEEIDEYAKPFESGAKKESFVIKLSDDGEPIIDTELFDLVRKKYLPYHRVLFYYFMGMFFVAVFAHFLYTMMSLSEESGITSTVQIIGSMAATALPIIFNLVWKHNSDEQKEANVIALKSKLRRFLTVSYRKNGKIIVEEKMNPEIDQMNTNEFSDNKKNWPNLENHTDYWENILGKKRK